MTAKTGPKISSWAIVASGGTSVKIVGGPDYLLQFLEPRVVTENIQRQGFAPIEGAE